MKEQIFVEEPIVVDAAVHNAIQSGIIRFQDCVLLCCTMLSSTFCLAWYDEKDYL